MSFNRIAYIIALGAIFAISLTPVIGVAAQQQVSWLTPNIIAGLNLIGWSLVLTFLLTRVDQRRGLVRAARTLGIETRLRTFEQLLQALLSDIYKKQQALVPQLIERRIESKEELSGALGRVVALAFKLLDAESAELALFDKEAGLYHTSFVVGKPFRSSAQAMLSGAAEGEEEEPSPDVLVQPIAFSGSVLGSLRVGLRRGRLPTSSDREIVHLLAIQTGLAIVNAEYTRELLKMRQVSDESVKAKTGFLANLSHEIRGPLGIILNAVELVADGLCGAITTDQLDTLKMVRSNGEHLLELINDVLDYAKIESGKIRPERVDIPANDLLIDLAAVVRSQADAKHHRVVVRPSTDELAFSCDRRHARQMLINLLTNAIKYTPEGGIIELWVERIPGGKVRLNVTDSGVGIEEKDRSKVFSAFERIENSYSMKQVGTGLGMPLTKRLAELNGGIIDFSSNPGKGTHFWLVFPAVQYSPIARESLQEEITAVPRASGETILFVQHNASERMIIERYLRSLGYRTLSCASTQEAGEAMRDTSIALALIDNDVVDDPNEGLLPKLREKRGSSLPVILMSSRAFVFDIENYLRSGVDRCVTKPIELSELARLCHEVLAQAHQGQNKQPVRNTPPEIRPKITDVDDIVH